MWFRSSSILIETSFNLQSQAPKELMKPLALARRRPRWSWQTYNRDPSLFDEPAKIRGRPAYSLSTSYQEAVRSFLRSANKNGEHITLATIRDFLARRDESFHITTLARTLNRGGFEFGHGTRSLHLKEKDHVIAARIGVGKDLRPPRPPNRAGGSPAHGSPVGGFLTGIGSLLSRLHAW